MSTRVSVIVPVLNEAEYLERCIESILAQDFPTQQAEIIFVDGGSFDRTRAIIGDFMQHYPFISLLENPDQIVPTAMNIGIRAARGEFIVRMDAHTLYEKSYISQCVALLEENKADCVGGAMRATGSNYISNAIAAGHHSPFGLGGGKFHDEDFEGYTDTVYLGTFKKQLFHAIGFYDTRLVRNQDIELNSRILASGGKIYCSPTIVSHYYCRRTLKKLWCQFFYTGEWNIITTRVNKSTLSVRHFVPLGFVSALVLGVIASLFNDVILILILIGVSAYASSSLFFSLQTGFKKGIRYIPILPVVFATLHFSYGLGGLCALLKLSIRNQKSIPRDI